MTQDHQIMKQNDPIMKQLAKLLRKSRSDPVFFARTFLNFQPYPYQKDFLRDNSRRIVACCGRQVGKTTLAAIKALHFALTHDSVRVLVISAGLRQSIYLFDKILELMDHCIPAKILKCYDFGSVCESNFCSAFVDLQYFRGNAMIH